jgi:hypothetical protein
MIIYDDGMRRHNEQRLNFQHTASVQVEHTSYGSRRLDNVLSVVHLIVPATAPIAVDSYTPERAQD